MIDSPKVALIQLISEQTIPNLFPICALRPRVLIHLTTPKTAPRALQIKNAAVVAGVDAEFFNRPISSAMPGIQETAFFVGQAIQIARDRNFLPMVNFTGGTKLMSIGAFQQAAKDGVPSFYVDTQSNCFVDGESGGDIRPFFGGAVSFSKIIAGLTLDMMVVASGHQAVSEGRDWRGHLAAARAVRDNPDDTKKLQAVLEDGENGPFPGGKIPRDPDGWLRVLEVSFPVPLSLFPHLLAAGLLDPTSTPEAALLPSCTRPELMYLSEAKAQRTFVEDYNSRCFAAMQPLQHFPTFLDGGWWEVIVTEAFERTGRFHDLRWSSVVIQQGGGDLEEDILALDGCDAVCVSCKIRGTRLLSHLDELNGRSKAIGGTFTRAFLALQQPPVGKAWKDVQARARQLRIRLLTPENLDRPESFD
jgi:hypothetical protein